MNDVFKKKLWEHIESYQKELEAKLQERNGKFGHIAYGTAGFRGEACQIEHLFFNIGILCGLRAINLKGNVGVMITASHNPVQDNGCKLIDSNGEMLHTDWEIIAENFCNNQNIGERIDLLEDLFIKCNIDISNGCSQEIDVCIGMDTRPSSEALASLVKRGLNIWSGIVSYHDYGILTTPALHFLVARSNDQLDNALLKIDDYYNLLIDAIRGSALVHRENDQSLIVDCANGVGAETMQYLLNHNGFNTLMPNVKLINCGDGCLNKDCGADYIKSYGKPPIAADQLNARYAALDGDADRIIYFYLKSSEGDANKKLYLLDGDRILSLYAMFIKDMLVRCQLEDKLPLGIIQTPYANGSSTSFLTKELSLQVAFTDTGVKNLHKKATEFDLAIYFEANGHGTIHVTDKAKAIISDQYESTKDPICNQLKHLLNTLNNYTGDAISDMILVEIILQQYNWNIERWHQLYDDIPNSLIKMDVPDKNVIKTTNAGQTCVEPNNIQPAIDEIVTEFGSGARCFVRPSGTENIVRIYAEAATQDQSDKLAERVKVKIAELIQA